MVWNARSSWTGNLVSLIWGWGWLKQALSQDCLLFSQMRTPSKIWSPSASRVPPAGWATPDRVAGAPSFWLFQTENPQFFYLPFLWPRLRLISCPTRNMTTRWGDANAKVSWGVLMYNSPSPARIFVVLTAPICFQDNHTVEVINKLDSPAYLIFVIFSPRALFLAKFVSTQ